MNKKTKALTTEQYKEIIAFDTVSKTDRFYLAVEKVRMFPAHRIEFLHLEYIRQTSIWDDFAD